MVINARTIFRLTGTKARISGQGFGDYNWSDHSDPLQFIDAPNLQEAGWSADYSTYLIGVNSDDSYDILADTLDDPDLAFRWRYDQLTDSNAGNETVLLQNIDPSAGGGGVGDVSWIRGRYSRAGNFDLDNAHAWFR
jgi:hypothetical protein